MKRTTTLIVTIGRSFDRPTERVAEAAGNVGLQHAPEPVESLTDWVDALREAWMAAQRRSSIYTIMKTDPVAPVVREWARRLDGHESDLELAIGLIGDAPVPDFYLVDPAIQGTAAHWYLDHLTRLAPRRVVLTEPTEHALLVAVGRLPYGRSLPAASEMIESARTYVPGPALATDLHTTLLD